MVYLPDCGTSLEPALVSHLRSALLVAFGDKESSLIRLQIEGLETTEQVAAFCKSQPPKSLIFVLDQFNGVQEDSAGASFRGSKQEFARDFFDQVPAFAHLSIFLHF